MMKSSRMADCGFVIMQKRYYPCAVSPLSSALMCDKADGKGSLIWPDVLSPPP